MIDDLTHKTIVFGFFMWLSAGIITGAVWANEAWGTYWSWDPKETWSIITWFPFTPLTPARPLHQRLARTSYCVDGYFWFFCGLFTYFGVNFFLSGLHSYGSV